MGVDPDLEVHVLMQSSIRYCYIGNHLSHLELGVLVGPVGVGVDRLMLNKKRRGHE